MDNPYSIADDNIEARLVVVVDNNLDGAKLTRWIELPEDRITHEASGYVERVFIVSWDRPEQSGTHRAHINNEGAGMLIGGEYFRGEGHDAEVLANLIARVPYLKNMSVQRTIEEISRPIQRVS